MTHESNYIQIYQNTLYTLYTNNNTLTKTINNII